MAEVINEERAPAPSHPVPSEGARSRGLLVLLVAAVGVVTITTLIGVVASVPQLERDPDAAYRISSLVMSALIVIVAALFRWQHRSRWKAINEHGYAPKRLYEAPESPSSTEWAVMYPLTQTTPVAIGTGLAINIIVAFLAVSA